ncbi:hypothetical protein Ciccas_000435 [Cichlidogyrus casuarinus]|uniref:Uncharacterized protein n=1 Tax=Cichlidogyrus casuarinus TaxID=1844966 RepID=A0ABD2QN53_9PLAT
MSLPKRRLLIISCVFGTILILTSLTISFAWVAYQDLWQSHMSSFITLMVVCGTGILFVCTSLVMLLVRCKSVSSTPSHCTPSVFNSYSQPCLPSYASAVGQNRSCEVSIHFEEEPDSLSHDSTPSAHAHTLTTTHSGKFFCGLFYTGGPKTRGGVRVRISLSRPVKLHTSYGEIFPVGEGEETVGEELTEEKRCFSQDSVASLLLRRTLSHPDQL